MTRNRVIAALTAMLTAMLLQATLVAPLALSVPVSLPAVVVAAIALVDGPGAGIAYGFAAGLLADLASVHPAGVLALCWLVIGVVCGLAGKQGSVLRDTLVAASACALVAVLALLLLALLHADGATVGRALRGFVPALLGDGMLALAVVPIARAFLHSGSLRSPASSEPPRLVGADR